MGKLNSFRYASKLFSNHIYKKKLEPLYDIKKDNNWISASKTRNTALNDQCLDYFKIYNIRNINDNPIKNYIYKNNSLSTINKKKESNFTTFILDNGIKFEDKIYDELCKKYDDNVIKIAESYEAHSNEKFMQTFMEMQKGRPIIYQGILHNEYNKTYGSCDLIVRSDWINKIINNSVLNEEEETITAKHINKPYHYRVIDIKCTKLHFNSDFKTIRNNTNIKPYKCQLLIYNEALGMIQGYYPPEAYILSNGWKYKGKLSSGKQLESSDPFDRLGIISYDNKDKQYYKITEDAVLWYRKLINSDNFTHNPPSCDEIYPNMSNKYDSGYRNVKNEIANKYHEITQVWNCNYTHRNNAMTQGVKSWMDPKCTTDLMGIKGKNKRIIDIILECNRSDNIKVYPEKIKNNLYGWKNTNNLEFYVDFEIINGYLSNNGEFIFMIGLGWVVDDEWNYMDFTTNNLSSEEECRILNEFIDEMNILKEKYNNNNPNIYHWNFTEKIVFNKICKKYDIDVDLNWFDFLEVVREEPIVVNGSLNFSLKDFAKAMHNHGLINTIWDNNEINNGLNAMYKAWQIYNSKNKSDDDIEIMELIRKYN